MKRILFLIFILISAIGCYSQKKCSEEVTAFLKALNGKWTRTADPSHTWGTWQYDITIKYINGSVKVSYPATILIADKERSVLKTGMTTATYDSSSECLNISYNTHIIDSDEEEAEYRNMDLKVSISIPLQTDVEDGILLIYSHDVYPTGLRETNEVMYYKH